MHHQSPRDNVRDKIEYQFEDMGEHNVKNIARPVRAFRVLFDRSAPSEIDVRPADKKTKSEPEKPLDPTQVEIELTFWNSVKDSGDVAMFGAYLEKYREGEFSALAKIRIGQLAAKQKPRKRVSKTKAQTRKASK